MEYLHWDEQTITDFSEKNISDMYNRGYVFTRKGKGVMQQTRSVRIDLKKFELSSENRRILKKVESVQVQSEKLPLKEYDIRIGKSAKDFYGEKFGPGIMSAQKVKEMLAEPEKSNYNLLMRYIIYGITTREASPDPALGWTIAYENPSLVHYSYPFYDLKAAPKDMGLGMMTKAIDWAKTNGKKYIYLGSLQRPSDTYKLQFEGLEWFDKDKGWQTNLDEVKKILASAKMTE